MEQAADVVISSPGRINLIGEHLDYNGGLVLPAAIDLTVGLRLSKKPGRFCSVYSKNYNASFDIDLDKLEVSNEEWHNYFLGVVYFIEQEFPGSVEGFECEVESNLPIGSGVSSSAALECGIAKGLDALFGIGLSDDQLIAVAHRAEHHFVGTKCGIMDQFAVVKGKEDHLIQLNCFDRSFHYVPAALSPYAIVLMNSNVSHNLATSEYNLRRQECETAFALMQQQHPDLKALAMIPRSIVEANKANMAKKLYQRARYVVEENQRTKDASKALEAGDLVGFGRKLFESHQGLSSLYEVSCAELDFLVAEAEKQPGVIGSRMMGGGFGGCTINIVHQDHVDAFIATVSKRYLQTFKRQPTPHIVAIGDGVRQRN
ncbi:MAG: galactokinase [Flavobacteriaceae bacterium]|nr:galactokinase [Flavobacteriaceae bacterium]